MPTPEQKARERIDRQLARAGRLVQGFGRMRLTAGPGFTVPEFTLEAGRAEDLRAPFEQFFVVTLKLGED